MVLSSRLPWYSLLAAVVLVPIVVGVIPIFGVPITLNVFVQAKLLILSLTVAVALASWAILDVRGGVLYSGRALVPLAAFVFVAAVSNATALDPRLAFFGDFEQGVGLLVFLLCALASYLTTQLVRDEERLATFTSAVILTATAVAVIGLSQQLLGLDLTGLLPPGSPTTYQIRRGFGTIGNADTYAAYLVLPAILAASRLVRGVTRAERLRWGACFLVILMSCVASQTRGPLVGLIAGAVAYVLGSRVAARKAEGSRRGRKKKTQAPSRSVIYVLIGAVLGGVVTAAALAGSGGDLYGAWHDFVVRFGSTESLLSLGGRLPLWSSAVKVAATHPLLGVGPDSFRLGWYPVRTIADLASGAGLVITDPHSVPLLLAATMGLIGLAAALYLVGATALSGYRSAMEAGGRGHASDYGAWLYAAVALIVTLLTSILASVLLLMLFLAFGVVLAPALQRVEAPRWTAGMARTTIVGISVLSAVALLAFALLGFAAQVIAVGARSGDADLARARIARAAAVAPWDSQVRMRKNETMVQAALEHVFTGQSDGPATVAAAAGTLAQAERSEPHEYLHPYRIALLLIGSGQRLGRDYSRLGIRAGLRGLRIYPNSIELRTGVASGYMQLDQPAKAEALLRDVWSADPRYLHSGITYAESLAAQKKNKAARAALSLLQDRFPGDPVLVEVQQRISPN